MDFELKLPGFIFSTKVNGNQVQDNHVISEPLAISKEPTYNTLTDFFGRDFVAK